MRHVLQGLCDGELTGKEAAGHLGIGHSRLYELRTVYLRRRARHQGKTWQPGVSGGDHSPEWSDEVQTVMRSLLAVEPAAPYAFVAAEVLRRTGVQVDRATVRRWARTQGLAHPAPPPRTPAPVRRWQRHRIGELWQLAATPHRWFPNDPQSYPLLDLIDDCSRVLTGARIYPREVLSAYLDFLPRAFTEYGLPLEIYVDYHSFFFTHDPEALTQLGAALRFYGVGLRYAPTPQAKGKVERIHYFWQNRLPSFFAAENLRGPAAANAPLDALRRQHNRAEIHRELAMRPEQAWRLALAEDRSRLRPTPPCPWWPYVWSLRKSITVGSDGRVPVGSQRLRIEYPAHKRIVLCRHPDGAVTFLKDQPLSDTLPVILLPVNP